MELAALDEGGETGRDVVEQLLPWTLHYFFADGENLVVHLESAIRINRLTLTKRIDELQWQMATVTTQTQNRGIIKCKCLLFIQA